MELPGGLADLERREVRFDDGGRSDLSEREHQLLLYLASHPERAISREEILTRVWGLDPAGITTRTIDMHVARLREKLRDDPERPRVILTVRGRGYMLRAGGRDPMKRPGWIWLAFGLCVALAALAMVRVGAMALELERAEARTRRQAALDENLQLALWRMDSALAPLIAEEGMRPYFTYTAFYPAERAYTHMFEVVEKGDVLVASPLLDLRLAAGPPALPVRPRRPPELAAGARRQHARPRRVAVPPARAAGGLGPPARRTAAPGEPAGDGRWPARRIAPPRHRRPAMVARFPDVARRAIRGRQTRGSKEYVMRSRNAMKAQAVDPEQSVPLATVRSPSRRARWRPPGSARP